MSSLASAPLLSETVRAPKVDTRKWRIREAETPQVYEELRGLLSNCVAADGTPTHVSDLASIFDEDAGGELSIDEVEFSKILK